MDNPQKENGYTSIANELMEALSKYRIPGEQMQCLLFIIRKTYGFNKKWDTISNSQFTKATGLKKSSVCRALNELVSKNIVYKKVNGYIPSYGFNKQYAKWKVLAKKITVSKKVNECLQKSKSEFTKKRPTKETITKETITKDNYSENSEEMSLSLLLFNLIRERDPDYKKPDFQKWSIYIDRMIRLEKRTPEQIEKVIIWCQSDSFWQNNILSTSKLKKQFSQLWLKMPKGDLKYSETTRQNIEVGKKWLERKRQERENAN